MNTGNESALARVNLDDPNLTELNLEYLHGDTIEQGRKAPGVCCCFPRNAGEWEALGRGIGRNTHLKAVEVDCIAWIGDENEHASLLRSFCQGLGRNRSLQRFALKFCDSDLFEKGILQELVPFLEQNSHLRVLDLCYSPMESEGTKLLCSALKSRRNKSLEEIVLNGAAVESDDEGESANAILTTLKKYPHLKSLELEMTDIGRAGCTTLSSLLQSPKSKLQVLNLRDSSIDRDKLVTLTASLSKNTALRELNLSGNLSITATEGWEPLLSLLQSPTCNLKSLVLNDNSISCDVAVALANSLAKNRMLTSLSLSENPSITASGFVAISGLLRIPGTSLEVLDLSESELHDDVVVAVANSMSNNSTLKALRLSNNPSITSRGYAALSAALRIAGSRLKFLDLKGNDIDDDSSIALATSLRDNCELKTLCLGNPPLTTSPGWSAFARLLCDASSIGDTYRSNHTLSSFGYDLCQLPNPDVVSAFLELNRRDERSRRHKILVTHFRGCFSMRPFSGMDVQLLVHVLAWISKLGSEGRSAKAGKCRTSQSALFHFLRSEPSLFSLLNCSPLNTVNIKGKVRMRSLTRECNDGNVSKKIRI